MITDFFIPPGAKEVSPVHLRNLPANAVAVACRDNRFRRLTQWLGLARCQGGSGAFTCRVSDHQGVFGLSWESDIKREHILTGQFGIHYFPAPEESLCDLLRIDAAIATRHPDYAQTIRNFTSDSTLRSLFRIGTLHVHASADAQGMGLSLSAERNRRMISDEGLGSPETGWIIAPGAMEENLPAYALSRAIFDVLSAALSACTTQPPAFFLQAEWPGRLLHRQSDGAIIRSAVKDSSTETSLVYEALSWGKKQTISTEPYFASSKEPYQQADAFPSEYALTNGPASALTEYSGNTLNTATLPESWKNAPCWLAHDLDSPECTRLHPTLNDKRPNLIVVSGFLGSGKTTFLNNCIEYHRARERFVAVIQNEIGATGVDKHLIGDSASVLALDEGCVCCTLAGSLASGVRELTAQFSPEVILLETTGLANPLNLLAELGSLRELVRLNTVVTVIDAATAQNLLEGSEIARDQVRGADIVVCNKCDTATRETLEALQTKLSALNPKAVIHMTEHGQIHPALFMDLENCKPCSGLLPAAPHAHANHSQEGYSAVRFFMPHPVEEEALRQAVAACPGSPFRIKGIVSMDCDQLESTEHLLVQCVAGRTDYEPLYEFEGTPFLVLIGKDLDQESLLKHWQPLGATLAQ